MRDVAFAAASAIGEAKIDDAKVERAVLAAYWAAREAGLSPAECYRAGVEVWRCLHPDHAPTWAAQRAVSIILGARQSVLLNAWENA